MGQTKSPTDIGREAELHVVEFLQREGYDILAVNWRTPQCEIDIVARKQQTVYCVEVKYRDNPVFGDGLDAITPEKQKAMVFAATMWAHFERYSGNLELAVASVDQSGRIDFFIIDQE